jgi:hypothetical protein
VTKSVSSARQCASAVSLRLESYWQHLRLLGIDLPGSNLIRKQPSEQESEDVVLFSEDTEFHLALSERLSRSEKRINDWLLKPRDVAIRPEWRRGLG